MADELTDQSSILTSIKKELGITKDCDQFDTDILMLINSAFSTLYQLGIGIVVDGVEQAFHISDDTAMWSDVIGTKYELNMIKDAVYLRVKMIFDPPTISHVADAYEKRIAELDWRVCIAVEEASSVSV